MFLQQLVRAAARHHGRHRFGRGGHGFMGGRGPATFPERGGWVR